MSDGGVEPSEAGSDSFFVADGYLSGAEGIDFDDDNDADCTTAMQLGAPSPVLHGKAAIKATATFSHCGWAVLPVIAFAIIGCKMRLSMPERSYMQVFHNLNVRRCAFRCIVLHCSLQHGVEQSMIVYLTIGFM